MKTKTLSLVLAAVFLVALSSAAFAQTDKGYFIIKPGAFFPQSDLGDADFNTGFSGEIAFGWRFDPKAAVELGLGYFNTNASEAFTLRVGVLTATGKEEVDLDIIPVTLTFKGILPYEQWDFYGLGGIGAYFASGDAKGSFTINGISASYDVDDRDTVLGGFLGLGFNYNLTKSIFIGAEGKYLWTSTAKFKAVLVGVPIMAETDLDGIQAMTVIGFRF